MNEFLLLIVALLISGLSTYVGLERVIKVDSIRHITDNPGPRKVHKQKVPTLGGVGVFAGFSMGFLLTSNQSLEVSLR